MRTRHDNNIQSDNLLFTQKIESNQYNTVLAITGAIKGSSREKISRIKTRKPGNVLLVHETLFIMQSYK